MEKEHRLAFLIAEIERNAIKVDSMRVHISELLLGAPGPGPRRPYDMSPARLELVSPAMTENDMRKLLFYQSRLRGALFDLLGDLGMWADAAALREIARRADEERKP